MEAATMIMIMALVLTIVLELFAFWLFIKGKIPKNERLLWVVFIIGLNLCTNPLAHISYVFLSSQMVRGLSWIITEFLVICTEALLIRLIMSVSFKKSFLYSLILNGTSILFGELILWFL